MAMRKYSKSKNSGENSGKSSVAEIVVDRLINKIQEEGRLPWQRPFAAACMNWFSQREYRGINRFLLRGGEYITVKQLKTYNEKNGTDYWFSKGDPWDIVVFYTKTEKQLSDADAREIVEKGIPVRLIGRIDVKDDGTVWKRSWILRYYRVYNICYIKDKEGNQLKSRIGDTVIEKYTSADEIIEGYLKRSGVRIYDNGGGACYYTEADDAVHTPLRSTFATTESYYRTVFHELVHSTGVKSRLNRDCFAKYHGAYIERSREELVAEVGSLLLASEAGFRDDSEWANNSDNYILGWIDWMKDNKTEVLNGMLAAEKAKDYIFQCPNCLESENGTDAESEDE